MREFVGGNEWIQVNGGVTECVRLTLIDGVPELVVDIHLGGPTPNVLATATEGDLEVEGFPLSIKCHVSFVVIEC